MPTLSPYAQEFMAFLRAEKPEWAAYASEIVREGEARPVIEVKIPGPIADRPIYLATDDDEVTVAFAIWHGHFEDFGGAVECAMEFFEEKRKALGWKLDDRWLGSTTFVGEAPPDDPSPFLPARPNRVLIRSFRGTYDEDRAFEGVTLPSGPSGAR